MGVKDVTGSPRTLAEIEAALAAVKEAFIKSPFQMPMAIHYPVIIWVLEQSVKAYKEHYKGGK